MSNAKHALGTTLSKGANIVAELTEIGGVDLSAETIDVTTLSSTGGYREFIAGFKDAGEVSISGYFYPGDTNGQAALFTDFGTGATDVYTITFPASMGASWTFSAIVTGYKTGATVDDPVTFEGTLKVTGQPILGVSASAGLTGLTLTGTGGSLSPTFAAGTHAYTFGGVSAASVTVTATGAGQTLKLYVDGVYVETLSSGVASSAIAMVIGSKKVTIVANETGKSPVVYDVIVVKTA